MTRLRRCLHIALPIMWLASTSLGWGAESHVLLLEVDGPIGPATTDYLKRGLNHAQESGSKLVVIRMDTPGGLDAATRDIIKAIIGSAVPVATYVHPSGARAASAGTYILYASHIAAMTPATTLGAATPVQMGGSSPLPSQPEEDPQDDTPSGQEKTNDEPSRPTPSLAGKDAMTQKVINDAAAFIRGLAEMRGRNAEWAEKAVREAATLTASEALKINVVDIVAEDLPSLLEQMDGRDVKVREATQTLKTEGLVIKKREPDWRTQFLALITNPTIAYLLLMIGIYGLIFEGSNPGAFVPGVVGAICLLLGLFALQVLPINYAGLLLIGLGVALMLVEAFVPSFGILGIGGIVALVFGSIILMDTDVPGFGISPYVIGAVATLSGLLFLVIITLAMRAWRRPIVSGRDQLIGSTAEAMTDFDQQGRVSVQGEIWSARTETPIKKGSLVTVTAVDGLTLTVTPKEPKPEE